jgi:site-specific DNA-methyltransferase (adenine-specific)
MTVSTQKVLFGNDTKSVDFLEGIDISKIQISEHNPRKTWDEKHVSKLAQLIESNGYDSTFAVKCYKEGEYYKCFAGSNRLKACQSLGKKEIPVFVYEGYTPQEIWRMAYDDNEQADTQQQFSIVDVWLDYKEKSQTMTQQQIADVLGVSQQSVQLRLKFSKLPISVLNKITTNELINERHVRELTGLLPGGIFNTETLLLEIIDSVLSRTKQPTSSQFKKEVEKYNTAIKELEKWTEQLNGEYLEEFIENVSDERSAAVIANKGRYILKQQTEYEDEQFRLKQSELDEEQAKIYKAKQEQKRQQHITDVAKNIVHGDSKEKTKEAPENIKLIFTDPPYGMDFQSNRRTVSTKSEKIKNDVDINTALETTKIAIQNLIPKMSNDSAVLMWCDWRSEPQFRLLLASLGFTIKNSVIWIKPNHGTGDLDGSFAPKHERLLFAIKGRPVLKNRLPDVLNGGEFLDTEHPTKKPVDLIDRIIDTLTFEGDLIVDPFMGSGPTGVASVRTGRKFWGCELEKNWWEDAQTNIQKEIKF